MNARTEYLAVEPSPAADKPKAFTIGPARDPLRDAILQARYDALSHPTLADGAKVLFAFLLDLALSRAASWTVGVVTISTTKLSEELCRSKRAIWKWKQQLIAARFIWITKQYMPNFFPLDVFHITALDNPNQPRQLPTNDGLWGNGKRRGEPGRGPVGRAPSGKWCRVADTEENAIVPINATGSGTEQHLHTAQCAPPKGTICTSQGHNVPRGEARNTPSTRHNVPRGEAQNDTWKRHGTTPLIQPKRGAVSTIGSRSSKRLGKRAGAAGGQEGKRPKGWQRRDTQEFLSKCREVLGEKEVQKNSGLWVENLHADAAYAWKVIHDTASAKTEGRIKTTPARYATNVWTKELLGPRKEPATV